MKITWTFHCVVPLAQQAAHMAHAKTLGLPTIGTAGGIRERVAVVGGDPFLYRHLDELRAFDGEIWAVNGAWKVLRHAGIDATFYSVDASEMIAPLCGGARAILADVCHPDTFAAVASAEVVSTVVHGPTSATASPYVALTRGHTHLTYYGCSSTFTPDGRSHAYKVERRELLDVACNGKHYITNPTMLSQAEMLAELIRTAPGVFEDRSGGLLSALVADPDYDIIAASKDIHEAIAA